MSTLFISLLLFSSIGFAETDEWGDEIVNTVKTEEKLVEKVAVEDEFSEDSEDEFSDSGDEFSESGVIEKSPTRWTRAYWAFGILMFTILAGIFARFKTTRLLRPLFLLAAIVILGFYRGGPFIISSFHNTYLFLTNTTDKWPAIVLFLGIIPITYFFGRVLCGWICYLGAIQEFLYINRIKIFQTEKAQKIMRRIRYVVFALLLIRLTITNVIEWSIVCPFKVILNLYSTNTTGYILLGILLVSSLFIYRPFCKILCPVGLFLGWITKIPGASVLGIKPSCAGCKTCSTVCDINAITREKNISKLDNQECIMCGNCMSDCRIKSIQPFRKNREHHGTIILKGIQKNEEI